jgi:hypothetical protein
MSSLHTLQTTPGLPRPPKGYGDGVVGGAIQGIDYPAGVLLLARLPTAFLSQHSVGRLYKAGHKR